MQIFKFLTGKKSHKQVFHYKILIFLIFFLFRVVAEWKESPIFGLRIRRKTLNRNRMEYKIKQKARRECLACGAPIRYGRSDKKFCSDTCKNRYHNQQMNQFLKIHSKVMRALDRNHKILSHCLSHGLSSIDLNEAIEWGFNPEYVTGLRRSRMRQELHCFDIRYLRSDTRLYNIEKIETLPSDLKD